MKVSKYSGKCSYFGGPADTGMTPSEGLAFIEEIDLSKWWFSHLFLGSRPEGLGLGRSLNPEAYYCAMRCNTDSGPAGRRDELRKAIVIVTNAYGVSMPCRLVDWGPNARTNRIIDLSPGMMKALSLNTDDLVSVDVIVP